MASFARGAAREGGARGVPASLAAAGLVAASLAACSFDEVRPAVEQPTPVAFSHAPADAPAKPLPVNWPKVFGSPELSRLAEVTAHDNFDVAAAAARILQADAQTAVSSAPLFPQITSSNSTGRSFTPTTTRSGAALGGSGDGGGRTIATNSFSLGLTASYELDLWGRNRFNSLAAARNAVATRFARDTLVLTAVASVTNSYFSLLSAQDRLKIADQNLREARFGLEAIKGRLAVGTVTALEVAQQQSVVDQQLASFPPLQQQLQQAKTAIALLTGRAPESLAIKGGSLDALKAPTIPPGLPSQVIRRRPDVAEAALSLGSADASVLAARAALFPTVTLTAGGGIESTALRTLLSPAAGFGNLGAGLASPLLDGGALKGELDLQRGRDLELLQDYRRSLVQSFVDVENALIAVQQNTEHEKRLAAVVASARLAYDITKVRLREGTIDILTVINTEQTLFAALDAEAVVRLARFTALSSLAQAIGGGWTRPDLLELPALDGLTPVPLQAVSPDPAPAQGLAVDRGGYTANGPVPAGRS
ncbi:efflux transporter outer membrane subunit [Lichenibacterium dinghuense]|uniref:efflux transporter outer membrane subunit n=1 Tax=Lichenibacterium dinghuense TaxID=2895977 RepID=UPI001F01C154|nr:efflux transporter outer membrane subunit [Lichenibacterium sp. 6Y81]